MTEIRKFLIINPARSGSTMLRRMLDKHPEINCKGEIITKKTIKKEELFPYLRKKAFKEISNYKTGNVKSVGFKFKYHEYFNVFPKFKNFLKNHEEIVIIHLRRKNLLKRYISGETTKLRKIDKYATIGNKKPEQIKLNLNIEKTLNNISRINKQESAIKELSKTHKVIDVYYEDLSDETKRKNIIKEIISVLQVSITELEPDTIKQNSDNIKEIVINHTELESALKKENLQQYLD